MICFVSDIDVHAVLVCRWFQTVARNYRRKKGGTRPRPMYLMGRGGRSHRDGSRRSLPRTARPHKHGFCIRAHRTCTGHTRKMDRSRRLKIQPVLSCPICGWGWYISTRCIYVIYVMLHTHGHQKWTTFSRCPGLKCTPTECYLLTTLI